MKPFFFFCSRSNFRAVTRLETLATQAIFRPIMISLEKGVSTCPLLVIGHVLTVDIIGSAVQKMMGGRQKHRLLQQALPSLFPQSVNRLSVWRKKIARKGKGKRVIKTRATCRPKSRCQSDLSTVSVLANKNLHQDLMHSQPEYQAFLGKRGKMEAKKGESSSPPPPSPISNLLSPNPLGRPDTQANAQRVPWNGGPKDLSTGLFAFSSPQFPARPKACSQATFPRFRTFLPLPSPFCACHETT